MADASGSPTDNDQALNDTLVGLIQQALNAKANNDKHLERRSWHKLMITIQQSGDPLRPYLKGTNWEQGIYEELRNEALASMWTYISKNLDKYRPEQSSVMGWIKWKLNKEFATAVRNWMKRKKDSDGQNIISIDAFESFDIVDHQKQGITKFIKYIESTPRYREVHIEGYPDATLANILIKKLSGYAFREIASEFGLKTSHVSTWLYRQLKKFGPEIRDEYERP